MTSLAVFGCSWTAGTGVAPTDTFGARLSDKLSTTNFTNLGVEGSSNSRSVLQLLEYVNRTDIPVENSIAVFLITAPSRECVIDHHDMNYSADNIINITSGQTDALTQSWITHFASIPTINFNLHKNILSMQAICRQYKIRDYYIVGWIDMDLNLPGIDITKVYHESCVQLFGYNDQWHYLKTPHDQYNQYLRTCGHPSELGHELIAQTLHDWIIKQSNAQS
jgi:hypothetical protein